MQQASADRPRFRQDLVAEPIEDGGSKFIDVLDPDSGVLFRFYEVEYSLACGMDGQRDVAGIVRWAEEELGLKSSPKEIKTVIATLGDLGFIETGAAAARPAAAAVAPTPAAAKPATKPSTPATPAGGIKKQPEQPAVNRWDAPTAMGDADEYLAQGVVAGGAHGKTPAPSGGNVELGAPGARGVEVAPELPRAPELELGAPGAMAGGRAAAAKGADIALGAPGRTDVSLDLADHVDVGAADVKEAVRASQVMKAVDVPPELAAEMERPAAKPAKVEPKAEKPAARVEPKPAEKPLAKPAERPVSRPVEKRPSQPTAPRQGVSPVLLAALIIAILAAGGFAVYKYVLKKDTTTASSTTPPPPIKKPEPPPPPPAESQKLAIEQPAPEELKASDAQQVAWIAANDTVVKAGDPVAKFVGFKSLEADVKNITTALDKAKADVAAAGADQKKLAAAQKAQTDNEKKLAEKQGALDKFLLKAPAAGKVTPVAKLNAKVTPTDVVATLQRDAILVATFKKAEGATDHAPVVLAVKGSEDKLACNVVTASSDGTKIACPAGAAPEGTDVTFAGLDTSRPAGSEPPPPTGVDTGSAGSAAPEAGSAAPAAGSAAENKGADKGAAVTPKAPVRRPIRRPVRPAGQGDKGAVDKAAADKAAADKAAGDAAGSAATPPPPPPAPAPAAGSSSL